uniref:plasmid maintenance protein n=1 Tax=Borreliella californiensis TaxID=373543 RepID=UPI003B22761F
MKGFLNNAKSPTCHNKHQHKLISLTSTLDFLNKKDKKYTQKNILYYFNENLKRNGLTTTTLRTMQNYLYKLEKVLKVTTNYYQHMGVNCGTEIYYKLKYPKKECYQKINKYFKERKNSRFKSRVNNYFKDNFNKHGSVELVECLSNKNNNIKEEKKINQIEKSQIIKYFNKCNFKCKEILTFILNLYCNKESKINMLKVLKRIEIKLLKHKDLFFNKSCFKEKQNKLKEILENTKKQLEKNGYNAEQLKTEFKKIYENYKNKPHFIIEHKKYNDLSKIKFKLEKSIELKKENSQKDYENIKTNIFNILIEQLKEKVNIEFIKPIIKTYLNSKKKLEYNKVFNTYNYELLKMIENKKNSLMLKELNKMVI